MDTLLLKKDLSAEQLAIIQAEMNNKQKSKGIAYALWFFLGGLGGHRYYAGSIGMGVAMTLTLGGLGFWALLDVFFIGKAVEKKNEAIEKDLIMKVKSFA
ncbi:TM2 domain-containing protein [Metabacillus fastidiosus]|uniref:TM2 domain-containing protein n=1 Tax=Metabacillus fastidiosus TaxID=1458 RepID=UPI002DB5FC97|nr:TM2 domain-containing protein [Metabacillus fastidiosus]MEC2074840.1 TM2 domain-containing protein [Metabacillus fastidiosus]